MKFAIPEIYPITDTQFSGLSHTEQARRLIEGGARIIQLREKYASPLDWFDDARAAAKLCRQNDVVLIVNDRVDIAMAIDADGVHLGQTDLPPVAARRLLGKVPIIGYSTHSIVQVRDALEFDIDYLAFGPIFSTTTKADPDDIVGIDLLREVREIAGRLPLVAIGGIDLNNAASVLAAGADSIAVISGLLANGSTIAEQTRKFISLSVKTV
ncbi:MAG: thiamine phosphate synthase [Pyrinomonadaceae bacterium]|nr:thiamine phosphate synthase [Pyrinomonadaceae bacterium]